MEYIWSLFAFFAGYVVFELYEFNNRFLKVTRAKFQRTPKPRENFEK